jgi:molecular chaperone GrpE
MNEPKKTSPTPNDDLQLDPAVAQLSDKIAELEAQIAQAKDSALRAQADYQNLQRRSREEKAHVTKFATKALVEDMLEPLEHLSMTAEQLKNPILDMVLQKLWSVLEDHGLQELKVLGKPYDVLEMEVVDLVDGATESDGVVVKIVKRGYSINGAIIQHAKVVIGKK